MSEDYTRLDGRKPDEMRPCSMQTGIIENADGSAEIRLGGNWIVAAVYGPKEHHPHFQTSQERAILNCRYHMAPYSVPDRKNPRPSRREKEISKVMEDALSPSVILEEFPEKGIDVFVEVLQASGSTRVTSITVASLALADSGIPMRDLVAASASGKADGHIVLDVGEEEDKEGEADLPIAYMPNMGKVTLLQMDGKLTHEEFEEAFDLAITGCQELHDIQKSTLESRIEEMEGL